MQVIVQARKPEFFNSKMSLYEIVTEDGLMRPAMDAKMDGRLYCGGGAAMVERALSLDGDEVLYVGDHIYTDAALAKINFRWHSHMLALACMHCNVSVQHSFCSSFCSVQLLLRHACLVYGVALA